MFLAQHQIEFSDKGSQLQLTYCPACPKPHNNNRTNLNTCGINRQTGVFNCFRCGTSGTWRQFKALFTDDGEA